MSLLIQLRYRIRAIETIKKITHAMRLISMSARSRLKSKEEPLREYLRTSAQLLNRIKAQAPDWRNPIIFPEEDAPHNPLVILIGSQRGLCGNFNTTLFHFFEAETLKKPHRKGGKIQIIPIGKKAVNYIDENPNYNVFSRFSELNAKTLSSISHDVLEILKQVYPKFTNVVVFSNELKTFFVQKPHETILIPFTAHQEKKPESSNKEDYIWEQAPKDLLDQLAYQTLEVQLQYLLFESLIAEHAARFISMDSATRNAQSLLEEAQLQYNKLRQAKITKELTELVSSM
jgi:F-type H+-transporting ATPase subunit gamma